MNCFHCDNCGVMVFFQNDLCVNCGHALGFLPDVLDLSTLKTTSDDQWQAASQLAADWQTRTVSAYASSHPWEDWAETWAQHYLHMVDTLETAASFGASVKADKVTGSAFSPASVISFNDGKNFDDMLARWVPLTCALNVINRGMGLPDLYPFVVPPAVVAKLRFIHELIHGDAAQ